jgi:hypothetical protein
LGEAFSKSRRHRAELAERFVDALRLAPPPPLLPMKNQKILAEIIANHKKAAFVRRALLWEVEKILA